MSYQSQALLAEDHAFQVRVNACTLEQAQTFKDDQRPDWSALAEGVMRDDGGYVSVFVRLEAGGPGIADKVDNGDGTIDQSQVTDADLLSLTQGNWPVVAGLFFNEDGSGIDE